jgi:3-hydroxyisobutyrate dehydrogenase
MWQGVMEGVPASRDYQGGFATRLMVKDLGLAQAAAQAVQAPIPMGLQALQVYQQVSFPEAPLPV